MHISDTKTNHAQTAKLVSIIDKLSSLSPEDISILNKMLKIVTPMKPRNGISAEHLEYAKIGLDSLTPREKQVFHEVISGNSNKVVARTLNISPRTVEVHRHRVLQKLGARNAVDLCNINAAIADRDMLPS